MINRPQCFIFAALCQISTEFDFLFFLLEFNYFFVFFFLILLLIFFYTKKLNFSDWILNLIFKLV